MNVPAPYRALSSPRIADSCGLNSPAACIRSASHSPSRLRSASSAGAHPRGPVPVTSTRRAPSSYSLCTLLARQSVRARLPCNGEMEVRRVRTTRIFLYSEMRKRT